MTILTDQLDAMRERALRAWSEDDAEKFPATCSGSQSDVLPLLRAVESVLEKCDDYLKWERELPHEVFEFGMAEAARDVQSILTEKLGSRR